MKVLPLCYFEMLPNLLEAGETRTMWMSLTCMAIANSTATLNGNYPSLKKTLKKDSTFVSICLSDSKVYLLWTLTTKVWPLRNKEMFITFF